MPSGWFLHPIPVCAAWDGESPQQQQGKVLTKDLNFLSRMGPRRIRLCGPTFCQKLT